MKHKLALLSLLALSPLMAESIEEKVLLRPYIASLTEKVGTTTAANEIASAEKNLPSLISINVGCSVPSTTHLLTANGCKVMGLNAYVKELAQKIESNGVITVPASYGVVFSDGATSDDQIHQQIQTVLAKIGKSEETETVIAALNEITGVHHATFVRRENNLVLVTDQRALRMGEPIFRITPQGAVSDYYHSEEEYLIAFKNAGLHCEEIVRPSFFGEIKWKNYNDSLQDKKESLGAAYINNNPFTIFHLRKQA